MARRNHVSHPRAETSSRFSRSLEEPVERFSGHTSTSASHRSSTVFYSMVYLSVAIIAALALQSDAHRDDSKGGGSASQAAIQVDVANVKVVSNSTTDEASSNEVAHEKASVQSDLQLNATDQEQAYIFDSFHSAVDRLQSAMHEEYHVLRKEHRHNLKSLGKNGPQDNITDHNSAVQLETSQLEALIAENNELRRQQAEDKTVDVEAEIAKLRLWDENDPPDLQACKIRKNMNPEKTVDNLEKCSRELMKAAQRTMESKSRSQEANKVYVEKFRKVIEIMEELGDLKALWGAFQKDHKAAQKTLVAKAKTLEPVIKALGGGEDAKAYLNRGRDEDED